jgi:hypothetical protein
MQGRFLRLRSTYVTHFDLDHHHHCHHHHYHPHNPSTPYGTMSTASEQHTQIVTIPLLHDPDLEPGTPKRPDIGLPIVYWGQVVEHPHKMTLYLSTYPPSPRECGS